MPFLRKFGGKHKSATRDCSYEDIVEAELPPLHRLVFNFERPSKVKSFISKKAADISERDLQGRSALHVAAAVKNAKALTILLQGGLASLVDEKDSDGKTPLFKAVEVHSPECVLILIENGASPDASDNNQSTPLHLATVNKKPSIIVIICNSNGNVNIRDKMGFSPLHVAAAFGYLDIGKLLIEHGAFINSRDNHGRTPLMAASCEGTPKMVRLLLEFGGDPSLTDNHGRTAFDYSLQNQSELMSMILKEAIGQRTYSNNAKTAKENTNRRNDAQAMESGTVTESCESPISFYNNAIISETSVSPIKNPVRVNSKGSFEQTAREKLREPVMNYGKESVEEPSTEHSKEPVMKQSKEPVLKHGKNLVEKPVTKHSKEPATKHSREPVTKHSKEPVTKHSKKPVTKHSKEPATKNGERSVEGPVKEPSNQLAITEPLQNMEPLWNAEATPYGDRYGVFDNGRSLSRKEKHVRKNDSMTERETTVPQVRVTGGNQKEIGFFPLADKDENGIKKEESEVVFCHKGIQTASMIGSSDEMKEDLLYKLKSRNVELKKENGSLRMKLSDVLKQSVDEKEQRQCQLNYEKARLQYLNLRNQNILEDKLKECFALESKLHKAHEQLLEEIERTQEGTDLDKITKDIIKGMRKKMKNSDAKMGRLSKQLKSAREERNLLETEVESLRGEVMILNEMLAKKRTEQPYFDEIKKGLSESLNSKDDACSKLYEEELEKRVKDNEVLLNSLNRLRQENALLKEQHFADKQETQLLNSELTDAKDHILTMQYQLDSTRLKESDSTKEFLIRRSSGIERGKSDSTVNSFRAFESTFDMFDYNTSNEIS